MTLWADYSAGRPSGSALKAAGFGGVIRYVGIGGPEKRITAAEYSDLVASGVQVLLVAEQWTTDAWGGRALGQANARAALNEARALGIPDSVGIAAAADAHAANQDQINAAVEYARGFQDVLGKARTGFYGFVEVLNAVHAADVGSWYWRCGAVPSAAEKAWVNFWQRNAGTTVAYVSGIQCDINEQYNPVGVDMSFDQPDRDMLARVHEQLTALWPTFVAGSNAKLTLVDYARAVDERTVKQTAQLAAIPTTHPSVTLSPADLDALAAKVLAALNLGQLADVVADKLSARLAQ